MINGVKRLMLLHKFHRKKSFKFADLLKYLKKNQVTDQEQKKQQADELLSTIRPLIQQKIEKLLIDRVDRLLGTVKRQQFKIDKITEVLTVIKEDDTADGTLKPPGGKGGKMSLKKRAKQASEKGVASGHSSDKS